MTDAWYVPSTLVKFVIWYMSALAKELFYLGDYLVCLFPAHVAEWKFQDYN